MNNIKLAENTLGQRIKAQRIRMGLTQEQLAEKMFVPKTTISTYERDASDIKSSGFVFSTGEGNVYTPESVNRAIKRIYEDYNKKEEETAKKENREPLLLPHFSCHHLRHTFCTRLCENESNLKVIQSVMGHSDIQTTMDIYAECTAEKKQEVFATLNGKIMIK